jgi:hypothetical protein
MKKIYIMLSKIYINMAVLSKDEKNSKEGIKYTFAKYYRKPNGSATINLPKGFDVGLGQGEELAARWDGKTIVLIPLKKVNFE